MSEARFTYSIIRNYNCICCRKIMIYPNRDIPATKLCFEACKLDITGLIWQKIAKDMPSTMACVTE